MRSFDEAVYDGSDPPECKLLRIRCFDVPRSREMYTSRTIIVEEY